MLLCYLYAILFFVIHNSYKDFNVAFCIFDISSVVYMVIEYRTPAPHPPPLLLEAFFAYENCISCPFREENVSCSTMKGYFHTV